MLRKYPNLFYGLIRYTPSQIIPHQTENKALMLQQSYKNAIQMFSDPKLSDKIIVAKPDAKKLEEERMIQEKIWKEYSVY